MSRPGRFSDSKFLAESNYTAATQRRYKAAVQRFVAWCESFGEEASSYAELDDLLFDYFHYLFSIGAGKTDATTTLNGVVMYLPRARDRLLASRQALRGWLKRCPPNSYPPLTWELTVLLAVHLVFHGHLRAGVALLLGFDCLLRIGELTQLTRDDVAEPGDARLGAASGGVWIRIPRAKTGRNQLVQVLRPCVERLLHDLILATPPHVSLFGLSPDSLRRLFKSSCAAYDLDPRYVPHSLRHGGATWLRMSGWSVENILERGRWASVKSARIYINTGRALLMSTHVPARARELALLFASDVLFAVSLAQEH